MRIGKTVIFVAVGALLVGGAFFAGFRQPVASAPRAVRGPIVDPVSAPPAPVAIETAYDEYKRIKTPVVQRLGYDYALTICGIRDQDWFGSAHREYDEWEVNNLRLATLVHRLTSIQQDELDRHFKREFETTFRWFSGNQSIAGCRSLANSPGASNADNLMAQAMRDAS